MVRLSSTRGLIARTCAVCVLFAATACTDGVTSPAAVDQDALLKKSPLLPAPLLPASPSALHTGKYHDSSLPHATGRSGSAVLAARALRGADGVTRLLVTTGSVDAPASAPGELAKVQIKAYLPDGTKLFTKNYQRPTSGGSFEFVFPGLPVGTRFDVQANVRGIDRNRTDVVEVTETAKLGAVLGVTIDPPGEVVTGVPTVIIGTVRETNGQVGAYTSCVLVVDGVEVDRIDHIWVDAGDVVTCAFTHEFSSDGTHDVEVRLVAGPGDTPFYTDPPSDSGEVVAQNPNPTPHYAASVMDRTVAEERLYDEEWWSTDGSNREFHQSNGEAARTQTFTLTGTLARATTFPLATVSVQVASDAGSWHSALWTGLVGIPDLGGQTCVNQLSPENGAHFYLCSTGIGSTGSTAFGYTRFAGTVTYHSRAFHRQWDAVAGQETTFSWNNVDETYAGGGQMRPLGTAVSFNVTVTDLVGNIPVSGTVPLATFDEGTVTLAPYTCQDEMPYWLYGGVKTVCEGATRHTFGWSGQTTG